MQYLKDSLGVRDFIIPPRDGVDMDTSVAASPETSALQASPVAPVRRVSFIVDKPQGHLSAEASELLTKMIAAMGLAMEQVEVLISNENQEAATWAKIQSSMVVIFKNENYEDSGKWLDSSDPQVITSISPEILVAQPGLKRAVWGHLQEVMKQLKT